MIPQRNLSLLPNRLAEKGGRRIPEKVFEQDYCLSWFLIGLSHSFLAEEVPFENIKKNLDIAFKHTIKFRGSCK